MLSTKTARMQTRLSWLGSPCGGRLLTKLVPSNILILHTSVNVPNVKSARSRHSLYIINRVENDIVYEQVTNIVGNLWDHIKFQP